MTEIGFNEVGSTEYSVGYEPVKVCAYSKAMKAELNAGKLVQFHNYTSKSLIDRTLEFMKEFDMIKYEGNVYIIRKRT